MDLSLYLDILRRRLFVVLLVTFVAIIIVPIVEFFTTPLYRSYATVRVLEETGVREFNVNRDSYSRLINTYSGILKSRTVLDEIINRTGVVISVPDLRERINAESEAGTELVSLSVAYEDPRLAQLMTNELANILIEYVKDLYTGAGAGSQEIASRLANLEQEIAQDRHTLSELRLDTSVLASEIDNLESTIEFKENSHQQMLSLFYQTSLGEGLRANSVILVTPASFPTSPSNNLGVTQVGIAAIAGLFSGLALALAMENLDKRIHNVQQLENLTDLPILGMVPRGMLSSKNEEDWAWAASDKEILLAETYRLVSSNLRSVIQSSALKTILITSSRSGEGKTSVAANLAKVMSEDDKTIFLIEADLRHPSLDKTFHTSNGHVGLSSFLVELSPLDQVLLATEHPSLFMITGGPVPANPVPLLESPQMDRVLNFLGEQSHLTLIDAPPVLGVADVSILAPKVDGVILVVRQHQTNHELFKRSLKQLQMTGVQVVGVVFMQNSIGGLGYSPRLSSKA